MRAEAKVVLVGKKNLKLSHIEQNGEKTVDDQITVDYSLPGSSRSNQSELLQEHRVDETIRSQIRLVGKNGHRWSAVPKSASRTPQRNILHIFLVQRQISKMIFSRTNFLSYL